MKLDSPDKELRDLRDNNSELALHLQRWKAIASEREREKLECSKEIKFLRMQLLQQRRVIASMNMDVENIIKEITQQSNSIVRVLSILERYQNSSTVDFEYVSNNTRSSPTNNIQHVQPMVQGHSILKPIITLARTVIETPLNCNTPSTTVPSPQRNRRSMPTVRPLAQLLESFVPLERLDMEVCRISDVNINVRRPRRNSYLGPEQNECVLDISNGLNVSMEEFNDGEEREVDMSMVVPQDPVVNGDVYSILPQIDEELEVEDDTDLSMIRCKARKSDPKNNFIPRVSLVPVAVTHGKSIENSRIENDVSLRPGPSWQLDDSDENENSTKNKKKGRKRSKKKKKQNNESKNSKNNTCESSTSFFDKENIQQSLKNYGSDDSDSENSVYNETLNRMVLTKRTIDSLKPVRIVINKLNVPNDDHKNISLKVKMKNGDGGSKKPIREDFTCINDSMEGIFDSQKSLQIANLSPETVRMIIGDVGPHDNSYDNVSDRNISTSLITNGNSSPEILKRRKRSEDSPHNSYDNVSDRNASTNLIANDNSSPEMLRRRKFSEDMFSYEAVTEKSSRDRQLSGRSRRSAPKNYKEKPLNKKLRRN